MSVEINATNFPDAIFRANISSRFDKDHDGILSDSEIESAVSLELTTGGNQQEDAYLWPGYSVEGIEFLTALKSVKISTAHLVSIDVSALQSLEVLSVDNCYELENIDVTDNPSLKILRFINTQISSINIGSNPELEELASGWNSYPTSIYTAAEIQAMPSITSLDISNNRKLKRLSYTNDYCDTKLQSITSFSNNPDLVEIVIRRATIQSMDVHYCKNLETLVCRGCGFLTSINASGCGQLTKVDYNGASVNIAVDFSDCTKLNNINSNLNQQVRIANFSNCVSLQQIYIYGFETLESLDLTGCTALEYLSVHDNHKLTALNIQGCISLKEIVCCACYLSTIDVSECAKLEYLNCTQNNLTTLVLGSHPNLKRLECIGFTNYTIQFDPPVTYNAHVTELDIRGCPHIIQLMNDVEPTHFENSNNDYFYYCHLIKQGNTYQNDTSWYLKVDSVTRIIDGQFKIVDQSESTTVTENELVSFFVETDAPTPTYQWEVKKPQLQGWTAIPDAISSTYTFQADSTYDQNIYRCQVTFDGITKYSDNIVLTVYTAPVITQHPQSVTVTEGGSASFTVEASGTSPAYQWQSSTDDGETWTDIRGATGTTYQTTAALTMDGTQYRCQVSNTAGTVYSNAATLTVEEDTSIQLPVITQQPQSATVDEGNSATFTVTATGDDLHYQWQGNNTGTWFNITGETSASYTIAGTLGTSGMLFRCIVSNDAGAARSDEAMITVTPVTNVQTPSISYNPNAVTVQEGSTASFRVVAQGGDIAYQWQVNRNGSWYNITDATSASYSFKAALTDNGTYYRCLVSNSAGSVYSSGALLTVTAKPDVTPNKPTKINKYFLVNGYDILPFIKDRGIKWSRNDVDGDNAGRVLGNANMQRDRLAIKVRCDLECRPLGTAEIQRLLAAIEPVFVTVQQNIDPRIGTSTRVMYSNNATVVIGTVYDDENDLYEDLTFPLIEQ